MINVARRMACVCNRQIWSRGGPAVLAVLVVSAAACATPLQDFGATLDALVPALLTRYSVPGVAVALICQGDTVWFRGYGYADVERRKAVTESTVFQVASLSKTVTAWGVMLLVERGVLDLDAPAERYLTRWHLPPSHFNSEGVTIRRLLSHTAGLSVRGYPGFEPTRTLPSLEQSLSGNNGGAGDVRIIQRPGSGYLYSGGGYTLLQLIIEEVTGRSFCDYMSEEILVPLGMTNSSFEWSERVKGVTAVAYDSRMRVLPNYIFTEKAAAGLYSTATDYARFVAAALPGPKGEPLGRGILSPDAITKLIQPTPESNRQYGLGYGIGWLSSTAWYLRHSGGNRGWRSLFALAPIYDSGIVILSNSDNSERIKYDIFDAWMHWITTGPSCPSG